MVVFALGAACSASFLGSVTLSTLWLLSPPSMTRTDCVGSPAASRLAMIHPAVPPVLGQDWKFSRMQRPPPTMITSTSGGTSDQQTLTGMMMVGLGSFRYRCVRDCFYGTEKADSKPNVRRLLDNIVGAGLKRRYQYRRRVVV